MKHYIKIVSKQQCYEMVIMLKNLICKWHNFRRMCVTIVAIWWPLCLIVIFFFYVQLDHCGSLLNKFPFMAFLGGNQCYLAVPISSLSNTWWFVLGYMVSEAKGNFWLDHFQFPYFIFSWVGMDSCLSHSH